MIEKILDRRLISSMRPQQAMGLTELQISGVRGGDVNAFGSEHVAALQQHHIRAFAQDHIKCFSDELLRFFSPKQLSWFLPIQVADFSPRQVMVLVEAGRFAGQCDQATSEAFLAHLATADGTLHQKAIGLIAAQKAGRGDQLGRAIFLDRLDDPLS